MWIKILIARHILIVLFMDEDGGGHQPHTPHTRINRDYLEFTLSRPCGSETIMPCRRTNETRELNYAQHSTPRTDRISWGLESTWTISGLMTKRPPDFVIIPLYVMILSRTPLFRVPVPQGAHETALGQRQCVAHRCTCEKAPPRLCRGDGGMDHIKDSNSL